MSAAVQTDTRPRPWTGTPRSQEDMDADHAAAVARAWASGWPDYDPMPRTGAPPPPGSAVRAALVLFGAR